MLELKEKKRQEVGYRSEMLWRVGFILQNTMEYMSIMEYKRNEWQSQDPEPQ